MEAVVANTFDSYDQLLMEAQQLLNEDLIPGHDRNAISRLYNGFAIECDSEAEDEQSESLVNHLFGYDNLSQASARIQAVFSQKNIWNVELPSVPPQYRDAIQRQFSLHLNCVIKDSNRLRQPIQSISGDASLFGRGTLVYDNLTDWWPEYTEVLVPFGIKANKDDVPYFIAPNFITRKELESAKKANKDGWNMLAVQQCIDVLEQAVATSGNNQTTQQQTTGEVMDARQVGAPMGQMNRLRIPVFFCYVSDPTKESSWDLVVIPRYGAEQTTYINKQVAAGAYTGKEGYLYHGKDIYHNVDQLLHTLFLEANIGGDLLWHKIMGLGRLNFETDSDYEEAFNQMMTSMKEHMRRTWKVSPGSDVDKLEAFLADATNIIPEGVDVVEFQKSPNYQHIMAGMNMLRQQSNLAAANAIGSSSEFNEDLQVQAVERQQRQQEMMNHRMAAVYEFADTLGAEIVRRFLNASPRSGTKAYRDVQKFRKLLMADLEKYGIQDQMDQFKNEEGGCLTSVYVMTARAPGDGNTLRAIQGSRYLMANSARFSPQAQQDILRNAAAIETGDEDKAENLVPRQPEPDAFQNYEALTENNSAASYGLAGMPMPILRTNIPLIHIPLHMMGLQGLIKKGVSIGWDEVDLAASVALGAHTVLHIQQLQAIPEMKQMATKFMQELEGMARQAQEFQKNLQTSRQAEEMTPKDQADLQLKAANLQLQQRKQEATEANRKVTQDHRERDLAGRQAAEAKRLAIQENSSEVDNAAKVAKIASP